MEVGMVDMEVAMMVREHKRILINFKYWYIDSWNIDDIHMINIILKND